MMRILAIGGAMMLAMSGTASASAQDQFESEVLRRLERLERRIDELERGGRRGYDGDYSRSRSESRSEAPRNEVVAAVSLLCGADCGMAAQSYCRNTGFRNGVAITIEKRGAFDHVTRARCFN